jgi:hypothetical protein
MMFVNHIFTWNLSPRKFPAKCPLGKNHCPHHNPMGWDYWNSTVHHWLQLEHPWLPLVSLASIGFHGQPSWEHLDTTGTGTPSEIWLPLDLPLATIGFTTGCHWLLLGPTGYHWLPLDPATSILTSDLCPQW